MTQFQNEPNSLRMIADYVDALARGDHRQMESLRAPGFVLDFVHGDAFEDGPLTAEETEAFWPAWFAAFPEMDYEVTRTVAAPSVVITQWVFTGTQTQTLGPPVLDPPLPPSGRTIRFRGVTVYDVAENGRIQRETTYMDLATLMVELGVTP
ncbi:MAG: ester cyclase [Chloroflexi bacterium]|nr:ester cyclase [Chloroflexota bacterium]